MCVSVANIYSLQGFLLNVVSSSDSRINITRVFNVSVNGSITQDQITKPVSYLLHHLILSNHLILLHDLIHSQVAC